MREPDLDLLFHQIRESSPEVPRGLVPGVLSHLGPSARQVRTILVAGATSCAVAMLLAALIGATVPPPEIDTAPPEFTLLTRGAGPLASL